MMQRKSLQDWLRAATLTAFALAAACASAADKAGSVQLVLGDATVVGADGKSRPVARGDAIEPGQVLQTGASGHVHMQMIDGAFVSVRPKSRLRIEEYRYDPAKPANNRIKFVLEEGVARSITGKAGEAAKENFRLNTPLAAIGIRGTDFVVQAAADVTRVTVQSGAISMSRFSEACQASGYGACNTPTTRHLTEGMRNAYLELRARSEVPMLVPAEKALESPNVIAPPAKEEPRISLEKSAKPNVLPDTRDTLRDVAADTIKAKVDANSNNAGGGSTTTPNPPPSLTPPQVEVVTPPPVITAVPDPQFWWGRWSSFIRPGQEAQEYVAATDPSNKERTFVGGNDVFGLRRSTGLLEVPTSGVAKFSLGGAEAYFMSGTTLTAAEVSSPSLTIDFGARRFETSLTLKSAEQGAYVFSTGGQVTQYGTLYNDVGSPVNLTGSLNKDMSQAGYVFQRPISTTTSVVGATRWYR